MLGNIWYSDALFGAAYLKFAGISEARFKSQRPQNDLLLSVTIDISFKFLRTVIYMIVVGNFEKVYNAINY